MGIPWVAPSKPVLEESLTPFLGQLIQNLNDAFFKGLGNPASCKAYRNTVQSIASSTLVPVNFPLEFWDTTGAMHDLVTNNDRIIAPSPGIYDITWAVRMGPGLTTSYMIVRPYVNGGFIDESLFPGNTSSYCEGTGACKVNLQAGDYVQLYVNQATGGPINVDNGFAPSLALTKVVDL